MKNKIYLLATIGVLWCANSAIAQVRPDITNTALFSTQDRALLATEMQNYIDLQVIQEHCNYNTQPLTTIPNIHSDFDFLPFHRMYLQGMEDYLTLQGLNQFVPLPKWDQTSALPSNLRIIDGVCSSLVSSDCANSGISCSMSINWNPNNPLPSNLSTNIQAGTNNDICDWSMNPTAPPTSGVHGTFQNPQTCPTCNDCCPSGLSRTIESPYHNNGHGLMGGAMITFASPVLLSFWLWHSHIDDVWKSWEENCPSSTTLPVDLWMQDNNYIKESIRDRGEEPNIDNGPMWVSKDIWIRTQQDGFTNDQHQNNFEWQSGVPDYVYVRVRNRGYNPSLGTEEIRLYWAKAATSLAWPNNWNGTNLPGTSVLAGNEIASSPKIISTSIKAQGQQIIEFEWYPPNPDDYLGINSEEWHFCLLARLTGAGAGNNDVITTTETSSVSNNVRNNNNLAWKNISIQNAIPGIIAGGGNGCGEDLMERIGTAVATGNPFGYEETFNLTFTVPEDELQLTTPSQPGEAVIDMYGKPTRIQYSGTTTKLETSITEEGTVMISMDNGLYQKWKDGGKVGTGFKQVESPIMSTQNVFIITDKVANFNNITINPHETFTSSLMVVYPTDPVSEKEDFEYDIIQKITATEEVIGGVQYQIKKTDCTTKIAFAGDDQTIDIGCNAILTADQTEPCATYQWFNHARELIGESAYLAVSPSSTETYILKMTSEEGCISEDQVTINVTNNGCLKRDEIINVFPNPAIDYITVQYNTGNINNADLRIIKTSGHGIERTYQLDLSTDEILINVREYSLGTYQIILTCDGVVKDTKNLVIQ